MSDLLIRNIKPHLERQIKERARKHRHSLSEEVQALIQRGLAVPEPKMELGEWLFSLVDEKDRGEDLVFEVKDYPKPPDFK
jgi:plasmid stability protein